MRTLPLEIFRNIIVVDPYPFAVLQKVLCVPHLRQLCYQPYICDIFFSKRKVCGYKGCHRWATSVIDVDVETRPVHRCNAHRCMSNGALGLGANEVDDARKKFNGRAVFLKKCEDVITRLARHGYTECIKLFLWALVLNDDASAKNSTKRMKPTRLIKSGLIWKQAAPNKRLGLVRYLIGQLTLDHETLQTQLAMQLIDLSKSENFNKVLRIGTALGTVFRVGTRLDLPVFQRVIKSLQNTPRCHLDILTFSRGFDWYTQTINMSGYGYNHLKRPGHDDTDWSLALLCYSGGAPFGEGNWTPTILDITVVSSGLDENRKNWSLSSMFNLHHLVPDAITFHIASVANVADSTYKKLWDRLDAQKAQVHRFHEHMYAILMASICYDRLGHFKETMKRIIANDPDPAPVIATVLDTAVKNKAWNIVSFCSHLDWIRTHDTNILVRPATGPGDNIYRNILPLNEDQMRLLLICGYILPNAEDIFPIPFEHPALAAAFLKSKVHGDAYLTWVNENNLTMDLRKVLAPYITV